MPLQFRWFLHVVEVHVVLCYTLENGFLKARIP